jgi:hypothetical protein
MVSHPFVSVYLNILQTLTHPYFGVLQIDINTCSLYSKGRVLGHKRGKRNSRPNTTLVQVEGVADKKEAQFYLGKVSTGERYISRF